MVDSKEFTPMNDPSFDNEPKVRVWKESVVRAGCAMESLKPLSLLRKPNGELLFALFDAKIRAPEGYALPNFVFIRGDAVIVVPLLRNSDTGEERFLMVRQRRIGCGGAECLEFPAGMVDADVNDPRGVAVREFVEETGLDLEPQELFPLTSGKLFSSAGASDEGIWFFGCVKELEAERFRSIHGTTRGSREENEHLSIALASRDEVVAESTSIQARLALSLFEKHQSEPLR
jgi:8-oxo-dGTP pyrophosphatase MutT (NUDIX family)